MLNLLTQSVNEKSWCGLGWLCHMPFHTFDTEFILFYIALLHFKLSIFLQTFRFTTARHRLLYVIGFLRELCKVEWNKVEEKVEMVLAVVVVLLRFSTFASTHAVARLNTGNHCTNIRENTRKTDIRFACIEN